jgi:hypothetical protein
MCMLLLDVGCSLKRRRAGSRPTQELHQQLQYLHQHSQQQQLQQQLQLLSQLQQPQQQQRQQQQQQQQQFKLPPISTLLRETQYSLDIVQTRSVEPFVELSRKRSTAAVTTSADRCGSYAAAATARPCKRAHTSAPLLNLPCEQQSDFIDFLSSISSSINSSSSGSNSNSSSSSASTGSSSSGCEALHPAFSLEPHHEDSAVGLLLISAAAAAVAAD